MITSKILLDGIYKNARRERSLAVQMRPQESDQVVHSLQIDEMDSLDEPCFQWLLVSELRLILSLVPPYDKTAAHQRSRHFLVETLREFVCAFEEVHLQ